VFTALIVGAALSCADAGTAPGAPLLQPLATNATVRFVGIEGGCWSLDTPQGHYEPINLPAEFRVDGLAVRVSLRAAPDMVSICMMGPLVRIDDISAR
jgi:hypothetical protein